MNHVDGVQTKYKYQRTHDLYCKYFSSFRME